jgi:hypothetical protein
MSTTVEGGEVPWKGVSFSCGGWLQFYLFGVARAMQVRGLDNKGIKVAGCSAGALAAAGLALGGDFDAAVEACKIDCVPSARGSWYGFMNIPKYIIDSCGIGGFLPRWNSVAHGELQVAVTGLPFLERKRLMDFTSEDDLQKGLLASAAIFPLARLVHFRGGWHIDGGLTDFVPDVKGVSHEDTISVSPFHISYCDIIPSRYIPFWWAIVPPNSPDTIDWIYALGYEDGLRYIDSKIKKTTAALAAVPAASSPSVERRHTRAYAKSVQTQLMDEASSTVSNTQRREVSYNYTRELSTEGHRAYGKRGNVSVHRFLGYKIFPYEWLEMVVDASLVFALLFIWKPLVLTLIYAELLVKVCVLWISTLLTELQGSISPVTMIVAGLFMLPHTIFLATMALSMYVRKLVLMGPAEFNSKHYEHMYKCVLCIGSFSLLSKYVSGLPSAEVVKLAKHEILDEISFVYRLCKHII